jgi:DNA-binding HxlR family transcriptional regulator
MRWEDIDQQICSVARTLSVVGDRWTLLIVRDAFLGTRRFEDFRRQLGISRHRLSDRLAKLVAAEVLTRIRYQEKPERFEYRLTNKGLGLYPVMITLAQWGNQWCDDGNGAPLEYIHNSCGQKTVAELSCSECGEVLDPHEVTPVIGPGLAAALSTGKGMFTEIPDNAAVIDKLPPYLAKSVKG